MTRKIFFISVITVFIIVAANFPVTTRQGIDYAVSARKIPLYIKLMQFFERDYYYRSLAKDITLHSANQKDKALKLFVWTARNIHRQPENFPVVDDHIMNIIIRGYGTADQSADVFTTLCEYSAMPGCFLTMRSPDGKEFLTASIISINGKKYFSSV